MMHSCDVNDEERNSELHDRQRHVLVSVLDDNWHRYQPTETNGEDWFGT